MGGELESSGVLLMAIGLGSIAFSIYWLLTSTEEDRGYHLRFPNKQTDIYRRDPVDTEQSEALKDFWRRRGWFTPRTFRKQNGGLARRSARKPVAATKTLGIRANRRLRSAVSDCVSVDVYSATVVLYAELSTFQHDDESVFCVPGLLSLANASATTGRLGNGISAPVAHPSFFDFAGLGIAGLVFALTGWASWR